MNLEAIQKHLRAVTKMEWQGHDIYLRKLGATDGIEIFTSIKSLSSENRTPHDDMVQTAKFNSKVISKSLSDEAGNLLLDSDEGRTTLEALNFHELTELGEIVLKHSGYGGTVKKNLAPLNSQPSDSASPSETPTARTPDTSLSV